MIEPLVVGDDQQPLTVLIQPPNGIGVLWKLEQLSQHMVAGVLSRKLAERTVWLINNEVPFHSELIL